MLYIVIICSIIFVSIISILKCFNILERFENIPLFIISLKRAQDRRINMVKKMKENGQNCIFFDAVDGKNMNTSHKNLCNKFEKLSDGEKGCFLSHYLLWKKILDSDYEDAIIFEDDAVILDNNNFKNIQQFLIPDYDYIYLGFCFEKFKDKIKELNEYSIYKSDYALCTHAYIVSKKGIKKLLNYLDSQTKWDYPIDHLTNKIDNLNKYLISPQLVKQSDEKSTIRSRKFLFFETLL